MGTNSLLAYGAFAISASAVLINLWQFLRKRNQENDGLRDLANRATLERDSFVVKGAEGALLMMEKMLNLATEEAATLRARVLELETLNREKDQKIAHHEARIRQLEAWQERRADGKPESG